MPIWYEWPDTYPLFTQPPDSNPPVANFTASPLSRPVPMEVYFTDLSTNSPTSWLWQFGDGGTSTQQNPVHIYNVSGKYSVTLTATNSDGSDSITNSLAGNPSGFYVNALPNLGSDPSGILYDEYYLYADKQWEKAPSGVSYYNLQGAVYQNAPIVVTPSGYETTRAEDPWAKTSGPEKYKKVGFGFFSLLSNGQYDSDAREFSLAPDASGKLVFNGILKEDVFIEYEGGPSGYYILDTVDYNPIRNEVEGGFLHFSQTTDPTTLFINVSQESVRGDGYQGVRISASIFDTDFDRVPNKDIVFELQDLLPATDGPGFYSRPGYLIPNVGTSYYTDASGYCVAVKETANRRGEAFASYLTFNEKTAVVSVKAYVLEASGVYDDVQFLQYWMSVGPFVLDLSLLDTLDYLV